MKFCVFALLISAVVVQISASAVLEKYVNSATSCETYCDSTFSDIDLATSCKKGCRLFTIIGLAKDASNGNSTENTCFISCKEAYGAGPMAKACNDGCKNRGSSTVKVQDETQTLHLLMPLMYVKSAYRTVMHHVKQLVTTSFTLYVEEDSGKLVVLKSSPKTVLDFSDYNSKNSESDEKGSASSWQNERSDWMDCISQQSGLPRWILVSVLFGFIIALLWLCCITTVTAPNQHLSNNNQKKLSTKSDIGYLYLYEPVDKYKVQPPAETEAPPLPVKVNLA